MKFYQLENLVSCIRNAPWNNEVHFGCDCGCGGDMYDLEQWEEEERLFDEATKTLKEMGITFDD